VPTFVVIAHEHPQQVARLAARLRPFPVFVHINARVDQVPFERATQHLPTVSFLPREQRVAVNWASVTIVQAVRNLLRAATATTAPDDHIVILSGADYPLHPVEEFAQFLRDAPCRQHLRYFDVASSDDHQRSFTDRRHYRDLVPFPNARRGSLLANGNEATKRAAAWAMRWRRPLPCPDGLRPMRGSLWTALTAECTSALLDLTTPAYERWMATTFCPDELYLHTLIESTPFRHETPDGGPMPYPGPQATAVANLHLIDDSLNKFFTIADRDAVERSDKWFVRKVAPPASDALLDLLDARDARAVRSA
jgi:hypothetical protein